jgi:hypothetical protein
MLQTGLRVQVHIPGAASVPTDTCNDIGVATPVQGEGTSVQVVLEPSGGAVVVLNVVHSTRSTLGKGDVLGSLLNGSGHGTKAANQSDQSRSELHVC